MAKSKYIVKWDDITITPSDENDIWESDWIIRYKKEDQIGTVSFAGPKELGAIPIKIELVKLFRDRGYGTKVLKMMVDWAFGFRNIYEVVAVFDHENDRCKNALQKAGFVYRESVGKTDTYSITKPKTAWTGVYILIGIVMGLILGIMTTSPWASMIFCLLICTSAGVSMDSHSKKERESVVTRNPDEDSYSIWTK